MNRQPVGKIKHIHAFTLLEMIAAMAVMIFVALIIAAASMTFYNAWQRAVRIGDRLKACQAIDRIMDNCVRNMIPFRWTDKDLDQERVVFQGEPDSIHFAALRRAGRNGSGALLFIRLKVEEEKLIAEYSFYPRLHWAEESETMPFTKEVLADKVRSIRFLYASEEEDELEWNDRFEEDLDLNVSVSEPRPAESTNTRTFLIPLAVQMTVEWTDGTTEVWLRRTAGSSRNTQLTP
jgi:type II secretory pathway component PulJ